MSARRSSVPGPAPRFSPRDLLSECTAGLIQRPGRTILTLIGVVLGVGAFVAVLGLTTTATGQISSQFSILEATTVSLSDTVGTSADPNLAGENPNTNPAPSFPVDADQRVQRLNGVVAGGVWWQVPLSNPQITTGPASDPTLGDGLTIYAASAGAVAAMQPTIQEGVTLDTYDVNSTQHVVLLSSTAANQLGVHRLDAQPAIFINSVPYTVIGIYSQVQRLPQTLLGVIIPDTTALAEYGNPLPGTEAAQMLIQTKIGAAQLVAKQAPYALRPDFPTAFAVSAPPDPESLKQAVTGDLSSLFLGLAGICLLIGAFGIANTTLVSVLERSREIGLRRALGARTRHIGVQFLAESALTGTIGGLLGTSLGIVTVLGVAEARHWTAVLQPAATLPAPLIGTVVGVLAGVYPALQAARTQPLKALRSG